MTFSFPLKFSKKLSTSSQFPSAQENAYSQRTLDAIAKPGLAVTANREAGRRCKRANYMCYYMSRHADATTPEIYWQK
jgi:hypothetical protein